jgi:hypothetical protein
MSLTRSPLTIIESTSVDCESTRFRLLETITEGDSLSRGSLLLVERRSGSRGGLSAFRAGRAAGKRVFGDPKPGFFSGMAGTNKGGTLRHSAGQWVGAKLGLGGAKHAQTVKHLKRQIQVAKLHKQLSRLVAPAGGTPTAPAARGAPAQPAPAARGAPAQPAPAARGAPAQPAAAAQTPARPAAAQGNAATVKRPGMLTRWLRGRKAAKWVKHQQQAPTLASKQQGDVDAQRQKQGQVAAKKAAGHVGPTRDVGPAAAAKAQRPEDRFKLLKGAAKGVRAGVKAQHAKDAEAVHGYAIDLNLARGAGHNLEPEKHDTAHWQAAAQAHASAQPKKIGSYNDLVAQHSNDEEGKKKLSGIHKTALQVHGAFHGKPAVGGDDAIRAALHDEVKKQHNVDLGPSALDTIHRGAKEHIAKNGPPPPTPPPPPAAPAASASPAEHFKKHAPPAEELPEPAPGGSSEAAPPPPPSPPEEREAKAQADQQKTRAAGAAILNQPRLKTKPGLKAAIAASAQDRRSKGVAAAMAKKFGPSAERPTKGAAAPKPAEPAATEEPPKAPEAKPAEKTAEAPKAPGERGGGRGRRGRGRVAPAAKPAEAPPAAPAAGGGGDKGSHHASSHVTSIPANQPTPAGMSSVQRADGTKDVYDPKKEKSGGPRGPAPAEGGGAGDAEKQLGKAPIDW